MYHILLIELMLSMGGIFSFDTPNQSILILYQQGIGAVLKLVL